MLLSHFLFGAQVPQTVHLPYLRGAPLLLRCAAFARGSHSSSLSPPSIAVLASSFTILRLQRGPEECSHSWPKLLCHCCILSSRLVQQWRGTGGKCTSAWGRCRARCTGSRRPTRRRAAVEGAGLPSASLLLSLLLRLRLPPATARGGAQLVHAGGMIPDLAAAMRYGGDACMVKLLQSALLTAGADLGADHGGYPEGRREG